jgi:hypothetical protein
MERSRTREVWRQGCEPGTGGEAVARREHAVLQTRTILSLNKNMLQAVIEKNGRGS